MEDRDTSVSWAPVDDDGRSVLLPVPTASPGDDVSIRSLVVVVVVLTGDG